MNADALNGAVRKTFAQVPEVGKGEYDIPLADCLMSGYAMFALKDPSLLAFERRSMKECITIRMLLKPAFDYSGSTVTSWYDLKAAVKYSERLHSWFDVAWKLKHHVEDFRP